MYGPARARARHVPAFCPVSPHPLGRGEGNDAELFSDPFRLPLRRPSAENRERRHRGAAMPTPANTRALSARSRPCTHTALSRRGRSLKVGLAALPPTTSSVAAARQESALSRDLGLGDTGADVSYLQEAILGMRPNGVYDKSTVANVKRWQGKMRLPTTGYFGPLSRKAAAGASSAQQALTTTGQVRVVVGAGSTAATQARTTSGPISAQLLGACAAIVAAVVAVRAVKSRAAVATEASTSSSSSSSSPLPSPPSSRDVPRETITSASKERDAVSETPSTSERPPSRSVFAKERPHPLADLVRADDFEEVPEASRLSKQDRAVQLTLAYAQRKADEDGGVSSVAKPRSTSTRPSTSFSSSPSSSTLAAVDGPRSREDVLAERYAARRAAEVREAVARAKENSTPAEGDDETSGEASQDDDPPSNSTSSS